MNLDLAIKGSLANWPDNGFAQAALLRELGPHGLAAKDGRLAPEKALLDGDMRRAGASGLARQARAFQPQGPGRP